MTSPANTEHFDAAAATWDDNPHRRALTAAIAASIRQIVPLRTDWRALEYGCGTGALSFLLAPAVGQIVAADVSPGMIDQVRRKLAAYPAAHMTPLLLDLTHDPAPDDKFNLIALAMTLHHVEDVSLLLSKLAGMLNKNGWLAIADLCAEDGSFHDPMRVPHNGFDPDRLAATISAALGNANCQWQVVHQVPKNGRHYDVFLLTAHAAS